MKKITAFIFMMISLSVFSQSKVDDDKLRGVLKSLKSKPYSSEAVRDYAIIASNKIMSMTKDSLLIKDCKRFSDSLKSVKFSDAEPSNKTSKNVKLSDFSKEKLDKFRVNEDKFNSITFLTIKKADPTLHLYIGIKYGDPYLRMVCNYKGNDWVFYKKIIFLIDGSRYEYKPLDVKRDVIMGAGVVEKTDDLLFSNSDELIKAISNSVDRIEIRFEGDKVSDQKLSEKVSKQFKETLELYNEMNK